MMRHSKTPFFTLKQIFLALGWGAFFFLGLLILCNIGFSLIYMGKIMPGISMNGVDLSSQTQTEAARTITTTYNYPNSGTILLVEGDKSWQVTPAQLGFYLDAQASAQAAYNIGRRGSLLDILVKRFNIFNKTPIQASPTFIFSEQIAIDYLNSLALEINQPIREAGISLSGTEVIVENGQQGKALDIQSSLDAITTQIKSMSDGIVPLVVLQSEPSVLNVDQAGEIARSVLSQPMILNLPADSSGQTSSIQIEPADLAPLLAFKKTEGENGNQYQVTVNDPLLTAYLETIKDNVNQDPKNARFWFDDDTRKLTLYEHAIIGRTLDIPNSVNAINAAIQNGEHSSSLSFQFTNPQVTDDANGSQLGITELVTSYTSYFRGSSDDRVHNIKTAASEFYGLLIPPGGTLSMSDELGEVTLDNGYAEALIIIGDTSIKGVGGGVCQVSTTLFRTVFQAGFQILERHSHTYRVGYYEQTATGHDANLAGMDATVFVPLVDFKFTNDTPYWLLMETYVSTSNYSLTWKFYSTYDGREVSKSSTGLTNVIEAPEEPVYRENDELPQGKIKQVDWAVDGADVTVTRTVTKDGQTLYNDTFFTRYEPWPDIFEYGPGTEIPTPTATP